MLPRWKKLAWAVALLPATHAAHATGDAVAGEKLAQAQCSQCHNITRTKSALDAAIPSFTALAARAGTTQQSVVALVRGPHNSGLNLPPDKAEDVAAYFVSLRQP